MDPLQVSNLTFDPGFKVKWDHHTKKPRIYFVIAPTARKYETNQMEVMPCKTIFRKCRIWSLTPV